jgi:serine phosphatase RsbU (regulator of sigma subunit)
VTVDNAVRARDALQRLVLGCTGVTPADLPRLAADAAADLGVTSMTMLVIDYAQTFLAAFREADGDGVNVERTPVDGTLAGRAYALGEITESPSGDRMYVPMTDCGHRIGVLEVVTPDSPTPTDRDTYAAIATVLGQLVASRRMYGDAIEHLRRGLPMQLATEIVWSLLPPLTLHTPDAEVTGILEPCYEVGGDAFDYAISDSTLHVALFDAVGHGIGASAMTTMAVNAYRNARRCGLDLPDTYRSIDKWLHARHPDHFVTAVLAELSLSDGMLRTISAGHPGGLLLRDGQRVKDLVAPTALPLGLSGLANGAPEVVEEALQPGDHVLFFTDGVIEARSADGEFFGRQRLVDFVVRTLADRTRSPETMRRLVRAILDHQHENLQDDATAVLVGWVGR